MKLYTFETGQRRRIGALFKDQLLDLSEAYLFFEQFRNETMPVFPRDMLSFFRAGEVAVVIGGKLLAYMARRPALPLGFKILFPAEEVGILPPIRAGKILCAQVCPEEDG